MHASESAHSPLANPPKHHPSRSCRHARHTQPCHSLLKQDFSFIAPNWSEADIKLRQILGSLPVGSWNVNKTDLNCRKLRLGENGVGMSDSASGETLLFLTDEQLRQGIEAVFFAYRGLTADPDLILATMAYGRAHHRAIHFINRAPGTTVVHLRVADLRPLRDVAQPTAGPHAVTFQPRSFH